MVGTIIGASIFVQASELTTLVPDPVLVVLVSAPVQFDGVVPVLGRAPRFSADTDEVLAAHGMDEASIADLRSRRIIA